MGTNTHALTSVCPVWTGRASTREGSAQLGDERDTFGEHERGRDGSMPGGRRLDHEGVFEIYLKRVLAPSLKPGQVIVMDNLSSQKCSWV
jgi:hypothetical protein